MKFTKTKIEWSSKLKLIDGLRKNWFKSNDFGLLAELNNEAVDISMSILEKFRGFLLDDGVVKLKFNKNIQYNGIKNKAIFIKGWDRANALNEMSESIKNNKFYYWIITRNDRIRNKNITNLENGRTSIYRWSTRR